MKQEDTWACESQKEEIDPIDFFMHENLSDDNDQNDGELTIKSNKPSIKSKKRKAIYNEDQNTYPFKLKPNFFERYRK
jgi:hypothetical protein